MRSFARNHAQTTHDSGTGGFLLWIAVYAAFMLALIAFNGGTQFFGPHQLAWPAFPSFG
jgi:hypothetical protein